MEYTVKQLADLAGVSVRTLHYYDEIGLLSPSRVGKNGYRYYNDETLFRLQQILFYRELDFSLGEIETILGLPGFDLVEALQAHRAGLQSKVQRLHGLIKTIDNTILYLTGEAEMSERGLFTGFSEEEEKRYESEARQRWGDEQVSPSYQRWNHYTPEQKEKIKAEGEAIHIDLATEIENDQSPNSPGVQATIARWHQHMRYFYEPSAKRLRGLGKLYIDHPDFAKKFRALHPELPEFMRDAIDHYCDRLERGGRKVNPTCPVLTETHRERCAPADSVRTL
jgi:DNA-binding transcriptional MerR regulator